MEEARRAREKEMLKRIDEIPLRRRGFQNAFSVLSAYPVGKVLGWITKSGITGRGSCPYRTEGPIVAVL
jgi:hypothetical protein